MTGLQRQKLLLLTLLMLDFSTLEEVIGSSVHSAEDICAIGSMEIPRKENIEGTFQNVHLCVVPVSTMYHPASHSRLGLEAYSVTADEQACFLPLVE